MHTQENITTNPRKQRKMAEKQSSHPIKTMVVLVQENRSFDHMLGWMKELNPKIDGVVAGGHEFSNPLNTFDHNSTRINFGDSSVFVDPDPGHSIQDIYEQIFGEPFSQESVQRKPPPTMQGFAQNANRLTPGMADTVMNGFKPDNVPVYKELVTQFGVCDRWFASIPTSTQPNRQYVHSATSHGLTSNDSDKLKAGMPQKTIFDSLHDEGHSFGIYYQLPPATLYYRNLRKLKYVTKFHEFDVTFKNHCKEGKLPNYVVIEQRYLDLKLMPGNDDHPSHDVSTGQRFVKEVYEALRSSPQWNEMLFIIIYDEHGGFFDHVPTPVEGVPSPDDIVGPPPFNFKFDRLGVRVPAIFVSPWIEPGTVLQTPSGPEPTSQYEHSSIPATVKKFFNLKNFLTKRDAWAGTFDVVLNRSSPRTDCPLKLSEPVRLRDFDAKEEKQLSEFQGEMVQLAACLRGEHLKPTYPDKIVESMNVAEAAEYCTKSFNIFLKESEKANKIGADQNKVVEVVPETIQSSEDEQKVPNKEGLNDNRSFFVKLFSCFL